MKKQFLANLLLIIFILPILLESFVALGVISTSPNKLIFDFLFRKEELNYDFVEFLDVGQGDSTIIKSGDKVAIIDFGVEQDGDGIYKTLAKMNIRQVDLALITHHHKDHMGGFVRLAKKVDVKTLVINNSSAEDGEKELFAEIITLAKEKGINLVLPTETSRFEIGDASLEILKCNTSAENENNRSIISKLEICNRSFLFTGDCDEGEELNFIKTCSEDIDVLKMGHHGSKNSNCEEFLNAVKPEFAVASAGYDNTYNHPSTETLDRMEKLGIKIYRTDLDQNIIFGFEKTSDNKVNEFVKFSE